MRKTFLKSLLLTFVVAVPVYFYATLPDVSILKIKNPKTTALMELRAEEYRKQGLRSPPRQIWLPYGSVSEHLKKAVLVSEDASFFGHRGVDVKELKEALKKDLETLSFKRGGSTITMQLAKNLYLNPSKNPLRKIKEILIAYRLEQALSKRRIFEIYLNVVEFGRNLYGAEAASRHYFGKSAAAIDAVEAATLAALLPSPRKAREKTLLYRRNAILNRLVKIGYLSEDDYDKAIQTSFFQKIAEEAPFLHKQH